MARSVRRLLGTIAVLPVVVLGGVVGAAVSHADAFTYSGRILSADSSNAIAGVQVVATPPLGSPSVVATTAADGTWSFTSPDDEFALQFSGTADYQGGWYDSCVSDYYVQPVSGCTNGPGVVPDLHLFATFASGRILDSVSLAGVGGATVEAREADGVTVIATATTDATGQYRITGIATDEIALVVNGAAAGHASGFFGCAGIVATFPEACTFAPGPQGDRLLAPLMTAPRLAFGFSLRRGTITMFFAAPAAGSPTGYELTCRGPSGAPLVRIYSAALQTRSGFEHGRNRCTLRATSAAGPGPATAAFTVSVL